METAFRSGWIEMSKDANLMFTYLKLIRVMASHKVLIPCLLDLDRSYKPKQLVSIHSFVQKQRESAKTFIDVINKNS